MSHLPDPYKSYIATLTQTSTNAPTATVYINQFGVTMTWARTSAGLYTVTAGSATFTANKTAILISAPIANLVQFVPTITSTTVVTLSTVVHSVSAGTLIATATDALLTNIQIEIKVYP